ncbi:MAG: T9SS type A sorting domain-containing protein [Ignavibacteriaceae bacterium]
MKRRSVILVLVMSLFFYITSFAQGKIFLVYDVHTRSVDSLTFNITNSSATDYTETYFGTEPGFTGLPATPPVFSTPDSTFTGLFRVSDLFNINNFPVRTSVKISYIKDDSIIQRCSGTMIGPDMVLTAAHCVCWDTDSSLAGKEYYDSIIVYPAYNNGSQSSLFLSSAAEKYFITNTFFTGSFEDIALIKLKESIGYRTGWLGIAFNEDVSFFETQLYHKFSYPGAPDPGDTSKKYNGDTLYYSYGELFRTGTFLEFKITGIPGQSGSSIFSFNDNQYNIWGVLNWSSFSKHFPLNKEIFYAFNKIMNSSPANVQTPEAALNKFYLSDPYPNPFNPITTIEFTIPEPGYVSLKIYDILGNEVTVLIDEFKQPGYYKTELNINMLKFNDISSGIYICRLTAGEYLSAKKIILLK